MPLRSVEAASRDDAIAAAREQFGPQARVVGVRRVRSGGVLGFFATERYVAEVAEAAGSAAEATGRPLVPSRSADDELPADFSSPLASAAPARARAAAPARNGAAAWAAAARATDDIPEQVRAAAAAARAAGPNAAARPPTPTAGPAVPAWGGSPTPSSSPVRPADDDRVRELVGLLSAPQGESATPAYSRATFPRAPFPRSGSVPRAGAPRSEEEGAAGPVHGGGQPKAVPEADPGAPSPFTAALARMVAGDGDVRRAVQDALARPVEEHPRADDEPRPVRSEHVRTAEPSVPPVAHQEEEPVGDQVVAPPSATDRSVEVPAWAVAPDAAPASASPREEAIADLLRNALAQGHSDEALAGILRRVLAGASPRAAVPEPATAPVEPVFAVPSLPVPSIEAPAVDEPTHEVPGLDLPTGEEPATIPATDTPAPDEPVAEPVLGEPVLPGPASEIAVSAPPTTPAPLAGALSASSTVPPSTSTDAMWGLPVSTSLWGDPLPVTGDRDWATETPSRVAEDSVAATSAAQEAVAEAPGLETPIAQEVTAIHEPVVAAGEQAVEETDEVELEVAALAPVLARTASDPAPVMSLDATTVMPPLSLLPPLPASPGRGRGRPPVPPAIPRTGPSSSPSPAAAAKECADTLLRRSGTAETPTSAAETPTDVPAHRSLATVTRLPVAPSVAGPEMPGLAAVDDEIDAPHFFAPVTAPAAAPAAEPLALPSGDVADRLQLLGLPAELLGSTFDADVAGLGTYAALTRALGLHLPAAPELPRGAGQAVFVVGPGADALRAARSLAASLHLDPDCVRWATRGDLAGLAPRTSRISSVAAAIDCREESLAAGTVTIVAVDAPLRTDASWMAQMVGVWAPVAVWAVVEATRKPEDLEQWIDGLPHVDALIVQDVDLSADPAAVLRRVDAPVALLDGVRATPHRWASLLCERLESSRT